MFLLTRLKRGFSHLPWRTQCSSIDVFSVNIAVSDIFLLNALVNIQYFVKYFECCSVVTETSDNEILIPLNRINCMNMADGSGSTFLLIQHNIMENMIRSFQRSTKIVMFHTKFFFQ